MSEDNQNTDPFDFDFDSFTADSPPDSTDSPFDGNPFGDVPAISEGEISADNSSLSDASVLDDSAVDNPADEFEQAAELSDTVPADGESTDSKKKGFFGRLSKAKNKSTKENKAKKEKKPSVGEPVPLDWGKILCIVFSVFLLASLLIFNVTAFLWGGSSIMQKLCFMGAFNIVGLAAAAVPILFYKYPQDRTLPNVMLGISAVAMFCSVLIAVNAFYQYGFILKPLESFR